MLVSLAIRDVVLIERLDLRFAAGLTVITGETGAGKSILLDALSLVAGARADSGLIRPGADALSVAAAFEPTADHPCWTILREHDLPAEDGLLLLRRALSRDGRGRAYVNDQPVSVGILRRLGEELVEIHGQFESHGLLNPATHRFVLDGYGRLAPARAECAASWERWSAAARARRDAEDLLRKAREDEARLVADLKELDGLAPEAGEEDTLTARRAVMQNAERVLSGLNAAHNALTVQTDVEGVIRGAIRQLDKLGQLTADRVIPAVEALDRACGEIAEAITVLDRLASDVDLNPRRLDEVEERLHDLRAAARKHGLSVDALPELRQRLRETVSSLEDGAAALAEHARREEEARRAYLEAARGLSRARAEAAGGLDRAVAAELPPLKLERARFATRVEPLDEAQWGPDGLDRITFEVATNAGEPPGPLHKVASGGELARFMLALKVILARESVVPSLVFDEVDTGIGGATAAAVGERLARLGQELQVLVVTHSPQVAAMGRQHWRVEKFDAQGRTQTRVVPLDRASRGEEIARMLSGAEITDQARAAAASLLLKVGT